MHGRARVRTVSVRLRQVMLRLSPGAALRFLLTLGGILVVGWLLGGAGSAYAESATPGVSAPVPAAALSAVTDTVKDAAATTSATTSARQVGGALDRIISPARPNGRVAPAERVSVADTMDAISGPVRAPEHPARCGRICDLVRDLDEAPLLPPVSGHEPLSPGRIADVVPIGAPPAVRIPAVRIPAVPSAPSGGGSTSPAPGGDQPIWHHLGSDQSKDDRAHSAGQAGRASADDTDRIRAKTCVRCSQAVPSPAPVTPVTPDVSAPSGTMPSLNGGQPQIGVGAAYLPGSSLQRPGPQVATLATTAASPAVPSAVGRPSFSPD